jgi:hypothetical protein
MFTHNLYCTPHALLGYLNVKKGGYNLMKHEKLVLIMQVGYLMFGPWHDLRRVSITLTCRKVLMLPGIHSFN